MYPLFLSESATETALSRVTDFIFTGIVKFVSHLPQSPFDTDTLLQNVSSVLQPLNYFVPFYLFSSIFAAWQAVFVTIFGIMLTIKTVSKVRG